LNTPFWFDTVFFTLVFGFIVYRGIRFVDYANRVLMFAKLGALFLLIIFTLPHVEPARLFEGDPRLAISAITVMLTSFGFANIIPSLRSYFNDDVVKLRKAILIGSFIPLICYILWDLAILGALAHHGEKGLLSMMARGGSVAELTETLSAQLNHTSLTFIVSFFTTICVLTAFLCVSLALSDFLADGLKIEKKGKGSGFIHALTFLPSLIIVLFYPSIFVKALSYAGICCIVLIVLLPALMIWSGRYHSALSKGHYQVMGGKSSVILLLVIALFILGYGITEVL
jgi:tyrosine-specific transport protein